MPALAFDFEAVPFSPGNQLTEAVCMSFNAIDDSLRVVSRGVVTASAGVAMLADAIREGWLMVGANTAYDVLESVYNAPDPEAMLGLWIKAYNSDRVTDILLRQALIDFAFGEQRHRYNIDTVNEACETGVVLDKASPWRTDFGRLIGVPIEQYPPDAYAYSMGDADATGLSLIRQERIRRQGSPWFPGRDILLDQFRQARKALALKDVSVVGLYTNPVTVSRFRAHIEKRQREIEALLVPAGLMRVGGSRNTEAAALRMRQVYPDAKRGQPDKPTKKRPVPLFPEGKPSLDADTCEKSRDPLLAAFSEYTQNQKKLGTDITLLEKAATHPFHAHYRTLQSTGRTSTGGDGEDAATDGNVQNAPRTPGIRECYVAPTGYKLIECDLSSAELCSFGQICIWIGGWSQVASDILNGDDPLMRIGCHMLHTTYEEAIRRKEAGDVEADEKRTCAKAVCYGRKGMMGPKTLVGYAWNNYRVITNEQEATQWIAYHDHACPEMNAIYSPWCKSHARNPGRRDTVYDLVHPWSGRCRAGLFYNDVHNYPFQGLIADVAGVALWDLFCARHGYSELGQADPFYGCYVALHAHDSFTGYAPEDRAAEAAERMGEIVTRAAARLMPDVPSKAKGQVMNQMSKQAKAWRDENGRLIPWDAWEATRKVAKQLLKGDPDKGVAPVEPRNLAAALTKKKWPPYCVEDICKEFGL